MVVSRVVTLLSEGTGASRLKPQEERTDDLAFSGNQVVAFPLGWSREVYEFAGVAIFDLRVVDAEMEIFDMEMFLRPLLFALAAF